MSSLEANPSMTIPSAPSSTSFESALERALGKIGVLSSDEIEEARRHSSAHSRPLSDTLIATGLLAEDQVNYLVGEELGIGYVHLDPEFLDASLIQRFPPDLLRRVCAIPLLRDGDEIVMVMADPTDRSSVASLGSLTLETLRPVVGARREILNALAEAGGDPMASAPHRPANVGDTKDLDPSGVVFIYHHLSRAHREGATEILIEPRAEAIRVFYRLDSRLEEVETRPLSFLFPLIARLKILAGLSQSPTAPGQMGTLQTRVGDREVTIRVAIAVTPFGESAVISFRPKEGQPASLESWISTEEDLSLLREAIDSRGGLIVVSSPDPSVRKELVYSLLMETVGSERSVCTLERSIRYRLDRFRQLSDRDLAPTSVDLSLALAPDVLYVEDLWDAPKVASALQASLGELLLIGGLPYPGALEGLIHLCGTGALRPFVGSGLRLALAIRMPRPRDRDQASGRTGRDGMLFSYEILNPSPSFEVMINQAAPWREIAGVARREGWIRTGRRKSTSPSEVEGETGEAT